MTLESLFISQISYKITVKANSALLSWEFCCSSCSRLVSTTAALVSVCTLYWINSRSASFLSKTTTHFLHFIWKKFSHRRVLAKFICRSGLENNYFLTDSRFYFDDFTLGKLSAFGNIYLSYHVDWKLWSQIHHLLLVGQDKQAN